MVGVTLEYREKANGKTTVVTTECSLWGTSIRYRQGISDHLPNCPAREIYAEIGALRDGGPDPQRVRSTIVTDGDDETPQLAADGETPRCGDCGGQIQPEHHKVLIRDRDEIEHVDLCLECQTKHPRENQFSPATDGGTRPCDHHEDREATHEYEDGTPWCDECHLANLNAAAAARRVDQ